MKHEEKEIFPRLGACKTGLQNVKAVEQWLTVRMLPSTTENQSMQLSFRLVFSGIDMNMRILLAFLWHSEVAQTFLYYRFLKDILFRRWSTPNPNPTVTLWWSFCLLDRLTLVVCAVKFPYERHTRHEVSTAGIDYLFLDTIHYIWFMDRGKKNRRARKESRFVSCSSGKRCVILHSVPRILQNMASQRIILPTANASTQYQYVSANFVVDSPGPDKHLWLGHISSAHRALQIEEWLFSCLSTNYMLLNL